MGTQQSDQVWGEKELSLVEQRKVAGTKKEEVFVSTANSSVYKVTEK